MKEFVDNFTAAFNRTKQLGYIAIPTANHDFQRPNIGMRNTMDQLKVAMTFFLTMPGVPFIYYGDEIGMKYQMNLPTKEGSNERAGTRTPMQWTAGPTAGFSTCEPTQLYFPVDTEDGKLTVEAQEKDPNSLLNFTRELVRLRHAHSALYGNGEWELVCKESQPYPMVYKRTAGGETVVVAINPSARKVSARIPHLGKARPLCMTGEATYKTGGKGDVINLKAISAAVFKIIE